MNYVVTGSLGHISKPITQKLIAAGHKVTVVSSSADRKAEIESLGATAAIGSVEDVSFLTKTFKGVDAVYTMVPPAFHVKDWKKHIASVGQKYAEAVAASDVKYVVNLSSLGAHLPQGCGPVSGLHFAEQALNKVDGINVLHLRPGFFYYNFFAQLGLVKQQGIMGGNYGNENAIVLVHTDDIADIAVQALLKLSFEGKSFTYIASDEKTPAEIAGTLGDAINKSDLKWVDFTDEQNKGGLQQAGLSEEIAFNYTEMGTAMRSGEMYADYRNRGEKPRGSRTLNAFAKEFAGVYSA